MPILNIYLALTQLKGLAELHPNANSFPRRHPLVSSGLVLAAMIGMGFLSRLPGAWFLLSLLVCLPMAVAQSWLNAYWRTREHKPLQVRHAFTVKELISIIIGSLLLGLVTAGFFIVPPDFERTHQSN